MLTVIIRRMTDGWELLECLNIVVGKDWTTNIVDGVGKNASTEKGFSRRYEYIYHMTKIRSWCSARTSDDRLDVRLGIGYLPLHLISDFPTTPHTHEKEGCSVNQLAKKCIVRQMIGSLNDMISAFIPLTIFVCVLPRLRDIFPQK